VGHLVGSSLGFEAGELASFRGVWDANLLPLHSGKGSDGNRAPALIALMEKARYVHGIRMTFTSNAMEL
jgi:hypothetical protein